MVFRAVSIQNRRALDKVLNTVTSTERLVLTCLIFILFGVLVVCELCIFLT